MATSKIDNEVSRELQEIFTRLLHDIERVAGREMSVSLCIFNSEPGSRINYISNCDREDVAIAWASMIKGWKDGMPDIPAHKIS